MGGDYPRWITNCACNHREAKGDLFYGQTPAKPHLNYANIILKAHHEVKDRTRVCVTIAYAQSSHSQCDFLKSHHAEHRCAAIYPLFFL